MVEHILKDYIKDGKLAPEDMLQFVEEVVNDANGAGQFWKSAYKSVIQMAIETYPGDVAEMSSEDLLLAVENVKERVKGTEHEAVFRLQLGAGTIDTAIAGAIFRVLRYFEPERLKGYYG